MLPASAFAVALICTGALAACGGRGQSGGASMPVIPNASQTTGASSSQKIQHVVIMIQENRSFDNLFATFPGAEGATEGKTPPRKTPKGTSTTYPLRKANLTSKLNLSTYTYDFFLKDYDKGKMDGWWNVPVDGHPGSFAYAYVDPSQIAPYWALAKQYVLADHMFATQGSASFTAHQDLIRGGTMVSSAESVIDVPTNQPWGCDAPSGTKVPVLTTALKYVTPGVRPCFGSAYKTLRDVLDAKGVSWKYYAPSINSGFAGAIWGAFDAISAVRYGPEWKNNVISPETNVFNDISGGTLPAVSWVIPDFNNSDHAAYNVTDTGPSWVASVVNAIGQSQYWDSTAIVVVWDDWGGWYDHYPPPMIDNAGGLGFRVPMIVISPYAKKGYIAHRNYEFGSIVRFVEDTFGLGRLGTTDVRASDFAPDVFDFKQKPRAFTPISAKYSKSFFEHQKPSGLPVDTE
jgi:phospholipase C